MLEEVIMEDTKWFPKVVINKTGNGFDVLAGIKLKSILKGELLYPESYVKDEKRFDNHIKVTIR